MAYPFTQFLASQGKIDQVRADLPEHINNEFREVLGAIALRHQLMTPQQIDDVLLASGPDRPFHEVALKLGYLSDEQVRQLQKVQELENALQVGIHLMLRGQMKRQELLHELSSYFEQQEDVK